MDGDSSEISKQNLNIMFMRNLPKPWRAPLAVIISYCVDLISGMANFHIYANQSANVL